MAQVRKTSSSSPGRGVVHDITERRTRTDSRGESKKLDSPGVTETSPTVPGRLKTPTSRPVDQSKRLKALRQQIARGEYNPDPDDIARKLLEHGF